MKLKLKQLQYNTVLGFFCLLQAKINLKKVFRSLSTNLFVLKLFEENIILIQKKVFTSIKYVF